MMVCPVCEHQQAHGFECDVCGKDLSGMLGDLGPPPVAVTVVEGLEVTVGERVGQVNAAALDGLELNAQGAADVGAVPTLGELEVTSLPSAAEVPVAPLADRELDRVPDDGVRTVAPTGAVTCRYCQNVQAVGAMCERCGMRLPRAAVATVPGPTKSGEPVGVRCSSCGAPAVAGDRCRECGKPAPAAQT